MRKFRLLALIVCLFLVLSSPGLAQADSRLTVLDSSVEMDFPSSLNFRLSAESDANITDIRLYYVVDQMGFAQVTSEVYIEFVPATTVEAEWTWDMRKTGGLPPASGLRYWWTLSDADGDKVETEPARFYIEDSRYAWRSLTQGEVTLYWYEGDDSFASELMAVAQQALSRLSADTGAELEKPVSIYIYANSDDLRGSMIFPQEWTGGVAFTRFGIIAIGIAPEEFDWGSRAMAHELTHLVINQMTFNPYGDLPTWLDEGLAMYNEGELPPLLDALLDDAVGEGILISVRSISSPFSAYAEESALAYTQSYSVVKFLIDTYGQEKMFALLNTFRQGSGYDEALVRVYDFDMDGLNALWRDYIGASAVPTSPTVEKEGIPPVLAGLLAGVAVGLIIWLILFTRRRSRV